MLDMTLFLCLYHTACMCPFKQKITIDGLIDCKCFNGLFMVLCVGLRSLCEIGIPRVESISVSIMCMFCVRERGISTERRLHYCRFFANYPHKLEVKWEKQKNDLFYNT